MKASVLTEKNLDGILLATLIAEEQARSDVDLRVVGGGGSSLFSFARTLLAVRRMPVAIVIDADTPEHDAALERQRDVEEVIGDAAGRTPFRVIVAVPELAILFFQSPDLLRRVYGDAVNEHVLELAQLSPRRALQKLSPGLSFQDAWLKVFRAMNADDVRTLRESALIRDLLDFIQTVVSNSKHSAILDA